MKTTRRQFLRTSGLAAGATVVLASCNRQVSPYRFFTEAQARCVIALCEQIIPADEDPGATDAGVIYFIDRQLMAYYRDDQSLYQRGIEQLQLASQTLHGSAFESLSFSEQTRMLERMEQGSVDNEGWSASEQRTFFNKLVDHTMQGFYGFPRHGGNRDFVSYRMMGVEYPQVIGRNTYQRD